MRWHDAADGFRHRMIAATTCLDQNKSSIDRLVTVHTLVTDSQDSFYENERRHLPKPQPKLLHKNSKARQDNSALTMNERSLTVPGAPVYGKLAAAHRAGEDSSFLVATTRPAPTAKAPAPRRKADDEACEVTAAAALDDRRRGARALTGPRATAFATRENMLQIRWKDRLLLLEKSNRVK